MGAMYRGGCVLRLRKKNEIENANVSYLPTISYDTPSAESNTTLHCHSDITARFQQFGAKMRKMMYMSERYTMSYQVHFDGCPNLKMSDRTVIQDPLNKNPRRE